jgi:hypothetical protein
MFFRGYLLIFVAKGEAGGFAVTTGECIYMVICFFFQTYETKELLLDYLVTLYAAFFKSVSNQEKRGLFTYCDLLFSDSNYVTLNVFAEEISILLFQICTY